MMWAHGFYRLTGDTGNVENTEMFKLSYAQRLPVVNTNPNFCVQKYNAVLSKNFLCEARHE